MVPTAGSITASKSVDRGSVTATAPRRPFLSVAAVRLAPWRTRKRPYSAIWRAWLLWHSLCSGRWWGPVWAEGLDRTRFIDLPRPDHRAGLVLAIRC